MTTQQEQQLFNALRSLKKEVGELKEMLKPHVPKHDELLSTKAAMEAMGVGSTKMKRMLANGELPFAIKIGRNWKFSRNGITNYLSRTR